MTLGDKIVIMNDGRIQQVGTPHEIYNEPANEFVAAFIGSPSTNMFTATVHREGGDVVLRNEVFEVALPDEMAADLPSSEGDTVTVGIRPEYMHVGEAGTGVFDADIEVRELHGEHDAIYFTTHGTDFVVTEDQGIIQDIESTKGVDFDLEKIWVFDDEGQRLI